MLSVNDEALGDSTGAGVTANSRSTLPSWIDRILLNIYLSRYPFLSSIANAILVHIFSFYVAGIANNYPRPIATINITVFFYYYYYYGAAVARM